MPSNEESSVASQIVELVLQRENSLKVNDVRIGLRYTAVRLSNGRTGVAFTFRDEVSDCCSIFRGRFSLGGRPVSDLVNLLPSEDLIESTVGLACINAVVNQTNTNYLTGNILDYIDLRSDDNVGMVGHFVTLVESIRSRVRSLSVFEKVQEPHQIKSDHLARRHYAPTITLRPSAKAIIALPGCRVALISSTSIIHHTVNDLLHASEKCGEVSLPGASTPLLPEAFIDTPVTMLSIVTITEPKSILWVVSEGGGMRSILRRQTCL